NVDFVNYENGNMRFSTNGTPRLRIESNGDLVPHIDANYSLGSASLRFLEVYGTNSTINTSDLRYKKNIEKLNYGINEIKLLNPITFNWKYNDNGKRIGLIAQELEKVIPEIIVKDTDSNGLTTYGVRYTELIPVLISAIKEQQKMIEELQVEVNTIKKVDQSKISIEHENIKGILFQNYPNPFNNFTEIKYFINPAFENSTITIIELNTGKVVFEFKNLIKGANSVMLNRDSLPNGIYVYYLTVDNETVSSKRLSIQ
ncbi:MAG: tail fiber domain-containing protein, partial [Bacteroidia bacterium]|nr:tail fiber domain-containing protein [Bacteroidia bacterium]